MSHISVALVDDQELVRSGLRRILRAKDGFRIVAECEDGDQVEEAVSRTRPDVVVMDLRMRRVDGIEATHRLQSLEPRPRVLVLTTFDDDDMLSGALRAGASGFVLKDSPAEELIRAVRAVASGHAVLDPAVTGRVLATYRTAPPAPAADAAPELTPRELDVVRLIAQGLTNGEIACRLVISEVTVKSHIGHVFTKLGLRDRAALIIYAFEHGLATP